MRPLLSLSAKRGDSLPGGNALSPLLNSRGSPRKEERNVRFGDSIYVKSVDRLPSRWIKWRGDQTLCKAVESFVKLIRIHPALERIIGEFGKIRRVEEWYS